jgi:hypothetical protein
MVEGAVICIARERDRALRRLQVLAAEIRAHEQTVRHNIVSPGRPADDRLYRRLRQINGGSDDMGEARKRGLCPRLHPITRDGGAAHRGRKPWD